MTFAERADRDRSPAAPVDDVDDGVVQRLVEQHARFLAFLERRVESPAAAEEILQSAYLRALEKGAGLRDEERVVPWFFRLLKNAVVDHHRRRGAAERALARAATAQQIDEDLAGDDELRQAVCACIAILIDTLKDEYATVLRAVDLHERAVVDVAAELGITPNNAGVRLHRARQALKRRLVHCCGASSAERCRECTCDAPPEV
jgi:RNA polymerase sigma factor (sigma-70 family)